MSKFASERCGQPATLRRIRIAIFLTSLLFVSARTWEDQVVSGLSVGAAERPSANYRQEPQDETLAAARGFLSASILSAGVWLLVGAVIYWLV